MKKQKETQETSERLINKYCSAELPNITRNTVVLGSSKEEIEEESSYLAAKSLLGPELENVKGDISKVVLKEEPLNQSELALKQLRRLLLINSAMEELHSFGNSSLALFLIEVSTLLTCFKKVDFKKDDMEDAVLLTGPQFSNMLFPNKIKEFKKERSATGIKSGIEFAKQVFLLRDQGYDIVSVAHSHPGSGPPRPSNTDIEQQHYYDSHGMKVLGIIFTSDGFIRFYTEDLDFRVMIYGKGLRRISDEVYKISINP